MAEIAITKPFREIATWLSDPHFDLTKNNFDKFYFLTFSGLTDPDQLTSLFENKMPPVITEKSNQPLNLQQYIPLTQKRVQFLLSLMNIVQKSV